MDGFDNIVSVKWLKDHLNHPNVVVLNGTIQKVSSNFQSEEQQIENARFFDIKNAFSDASAEFPNTIPSEIQFQTEAQKLGINHDDFIVVYDEFGIYSSPRVWWLFKTFGHNNVAVLDGGFPEWKAQKFPTEVKTEKQYNSGNFIAKYKPNNIVYFESLEAINKDPNFKIIDARSNDRFMCRVPEPREGLRSGYIPNSVNLPYQNILNEHKFQHKEQIASTFKDLANNNQHLVFTCGSGITASILSLAATLLGYNNSVYDGSWTEYGTLTTGNMQDPKQWSKEELLAYILIFVAHSDLEETKKEKEYILSRVDKDIYKRVEEKFNQDNDYQSIQNIIEAVKTHDYYRNDLADLFADIKLMAFADGGFDIMEKEAYHYLKKILK
ncbi:sulfurtransferase [Mesoflavibacter sp.]|uniref:sulfurtransferase n=1 Tax=Mesoflavibacter sp. TaxID=1930902 RepID=UPI0035166C7D